MLKQVPSPDAATSSPEHTRYTGTKARLASAPCKSGLEESFSKLAISVYSLFYFSHTPPLNRERAGCGFDFSLWKVRNLTFLFLLWQKPVVLWFRSNAPGAPASGRRDQGPATPAP